MWPPTGATQELGLQTHGDRVALRNGTFSLGLGSFGGHLGPFGTALAHFWPFLAVLWTPNGAGRESGAQTHGDRVALCRGTLHLGLGSYWGHLGPFWADLVPFGPILASKGPFLAILSNIVVAD